MKRDDWVETTATIYSCGWEDTPFNDLGLKRGFTSGHYIVVFSYTIDGHYYSDEFASSKEWKEGSTIQIKYNPQNPEENDRTDEGNNIYASIAVYAAGIVIVALYFWWKAHK